MGAPFQPVLLQYIADCWGTHKLGRCPLALPSDFRSEVGGRRVYRAVRVQGQLASLAEWNGHPVLLSEVHPTEGRTRIMRRTLPTCYELLIHRTPMQVSLVLDAQCAVRTCSLTAVRQRSCCDYQSAMSEQRVALWSGMMLQ